MAEDYRVRNGGNPAVKNGPIVVNSYNLKPETVVATAAGTQLTLADTANYELIVAAQTSAGTDFILLPSAAPLGTLLVFLASSVCRIKAGATGSGLTINAGTDAQSVPLVVGARTEFRKQSATNWACMHVVAAGTITAPTPS